ncbi:hypothetical protein [Catellatospora sp. NPDC049609]|uniref:hypothetical protein n=1 Tax=Catellatospora sp. NPDC049609 TaxID=3155505 RepID=UPI003439701B
MNVQQKTLMAELERRVASAGLRCVDTSGLQDKSAFGVSLPRLGGGAPRVVAVSLATVSAYLTAGLENWTFVGDYLGVENSKSSEIELAIVTTSIADLRKLLQLCGHQELAGARIRTRFSPGQEVSFRPLPNSDLRIRIASTTPALELAADSDGVPNIRSVGASLFISGLGPEPDQARRLIRIQSVIDAVLFDLSVVNRISVEVRPYPRYITLFAEAHDVGPEPTVPKLTYSTDAVSLFRYAQYAEKLPLLRFLAFYQVLEYFFPQYSERDMLTRLRHIVADPLFNVDDNSHLARLWEASRGKHALSEKEQLKSTIRHCVDEDQLRDFLKSDPARLQFLTAKNSPLKAVDKLVMNDHDRTLPVTDQIANRVYQIRCRIVHSKGSGGDLSDSDALLPFGSEANHLEHDIEIARFVAQKVLITSAKRTYWK